MESLARWSRQKSRGGRRRTARRRRARGRARSPASSPLRGPYDRRVAASLTVVGSINLDLVVRVDRLPRPGETLSGATLERIPGGKGANQAVAAARLGAGVRMVGCIGGDSYGEEALVGLRDAGIELDAIELLLALASPELELLGVTTVAGNQTLEKTTANAIRVLDFAGHKGIPVAAGGEGPPRPAALPSPYR